MLNENVRIIVRDIHGRKRQLCLKWNEVDNPDLAEQYEEEEILFVFLGDSCVYSTLSDNPIDWEKLRGVFA